MKKIILEGTKWMCLKDFRMSDGQVAFYHGKTYESFHNGRLQSEISSNHSMNINENFEEHFELVEEVTKPQSTNTSFDQVIEETLTQVRELLIVKSKEYRRNGNVYHNFEEGAKISGLSREKVLDGFLLKHEISIKDMTNDLDLGIIPSIEKITEKFNDNLIYLLIKKAMLTERAENE